VQIPLFPLGTVLFPEGELSLRIFEPRYLSMVGERMKTGGCFGVVLIREGNEVGEPASFHRVGTLATIFDFDQLEDGTLGLTCRGSEKFQVLDYLVQSDNLITADIDVCTARKVDQSNSLLERFSLVSEFIDKMLSREELAEYRLNVRVEWNNPDWVSYQAAELLPLSPDSRQLLLEMETEERLLELDSLLREEAQAP
jgi:Lon protease-like protein